MNNSEFNRLQSLSSHNPQKAISFAYTDFIKADKTHNMKSFVQVSNCSNLKDLRKNFHKDKRVEQNLADFIKYHQHAKWVVFDRFTHQCKFITPMMARESIRKLFYR